MPDELSGFFFNVEKWFGSMAVQRMSFAEKGVYASMLFQQWRAPTRNLPDDPHEVAELIAVTPDQAAEVLRAWEVVRRKFVTSDHTPDRIWNVEVEHTRRKQRANRRKRVEDGRKGGKASAAIRQTPKELLVNHPSTTVERASSNEIREEKSRSDQKRLEQKPARTLVEDAIAERGGRLVERYQELFTEHRKGARYRPQPNLDWLAACDLCRIWDDARLEKLAVIVLTTDDPWISTTDRAFAIFAKKATWADDKLTQWEAKQVPA